MGSSCTFLHKIQDCYAMLYGRIQYIDLKMTTNDSFDLSAYKMNNEVTTLAVAMIVEMKLVW